VDRKLVGIPASPGIAVGPVHLLRWEIPEVNHRIIADDAIPGEIARLQADFHHRLPVARTQRTELRAERPRPVRKFLRDGKILPAHGNFRAILQQVR